MISIENAAATLSIFGKGEADQPHPDLFDARLRNVVRYADPASWICAAAVARALETTADRLSSVRDHVGVIAISDEGPQEAMQALDEAAENGFSSPLKFPAGNPGSLVGVTCILLGFRGPTLNFVMPPRAGVSAGLVVAAGWLERQVCSHVMLTASTRGGRPLPMARTFVLSSRRGQLANRASVTTSDAFWLSFQDS
jgi:hypothetical protein